MRNSSTIFQLLAGFEETVVTNPAPDTSNILRELYNFYS